MTARFLLLLWALPHALAADAVGTLKDSGGFLAQLAPGAPAVRVSWEGGPVPRVIKIDAAGKTLAAQALNGGPYLGRLSRFRWKGARQDYIGFVRDCAASADYSHWIVWDWGAPEPKIVLSADAGEMMERPSFRDLDGDGTDELIFENRHSKYGRVPQIFRWSGSKGTFEPADRAFPDFWNGRIAATQARMRAWRASETARSQKPRLALVLVAELLQDFEARGGEGGRPEFEREADDALNPLIGDSRNDYIRDRALMLRRMVHGAGQGHAGGAPHRDDLDPAGRPI